MNPPTSSKTFAVVTLGLALVGCGAEPGLATSDASRDDVDASVVDAPRAVDARPVEVVIPLATGRAHTCAIHPDGTLRCWGADDHGQLGDGTGGTGPGPVTVAGGPYVAVAAGQDHTCAQAASGVVRCWGAGHVGQLGSGEDDQAAPVPVPGLAATSPELLLAGGASTCAGAAGAWSCWGGNDNGQLGVGDRLHRTSPVTGPAGAAALALATSHGCALDGEGAARCWGWDYAGALGRGGSGERYELAPVAVSTSARFTSLAVGPSVSCAVTRGTPGDLLCWGDNVVGQLGLGTIALAGRVPAQVPGFLGVGAVAVGAQSVCAISAGAVAGEVWCWGRNQSGQVGDGRGGAGVVVRSPARVLGLPARDDDPATHVAVGGEHACALTASGTLWCWGGDGAGQLGDGGGPARLQAAAVVGW